MIALPIDVAAEESTGEGLGEILSAKEGKRRLMAFATSVRLEAWAGPIATPTELERECGMKRSALHNWWMRGEIVGLKKIDGKLAYPRAQFIDGRPIKGISKITEIVGESRVAWLWLITGGKTSPLERLKKGRIAEVVEEAEQAFS